MTTATRGIAPLRPEPWTDDARPTHGGWARTPLPPAMPTGPGRGEGLMCTALPLLQAEEEPVLGFWIEAGVLAAAALNEGCGASRRAELEVVRSLGEQAREHLTRSNIRLVYFWISRSWTGRDTGGLDTEDLAAVGIEGLIHAVWMWDYRRGLKFSTYASWWIRQHLDRAVIRARGLGVGSLDRARLEELFQARAVLEVRLARAATTRELADCLQISVAATRDLLLLERNVKAMVRLDSPVGADGTVTTGDLLTDPGPRPDQVAEEVELREELAAALRQLTPRQREVVMARVGWAGPAESELSIAARFGVTPDQVRHTTHAALGRLRELLGDTLPLGTAA